MIRPDAPEPAQRNLVGVDHVAYTYGSLSHLLENHAWLKERGIAPYWCVHHGITVSMYYANPDGNNQPAHDEREGTNATATCISGHIELLNRR